MSYLENRTYFFDQELSGNNSLDDVITFINVPAMVRLTESAWKITKFTLTGLGK